MKAKKPVSKKKMRPVPQEAPQTVSNQPELLLQAVQTSVADPVRSAPQPAAIQDPMTQRDVVMVVLYSVLLFLAMTVQTGRMTMILTVLALALSIGKAPLKNFRARLCVPVIGLLAYAVMNGAAAIYSPFDEYAVGEYYKFLASFSMAIILLARFEKKHVRGLLWGYVSVSAVIALLCVDIGCAQALFAPFNGLMNLLGTDYASVLDASEGVRVNGLYRDANITGALLGMAIPVAIYLAQTAQQGWKKAAACILLGISAVSFLIAMSRGAILCFCLAMLVYLIAAGKENRLSLFFFLVCTAIGVAVTGLPAMMSMSGGSILPVLLALASGGVVYVLDWAVGRRLTRALEGHGLAVACACGALIVAACVAVFVAFQMTEPYTCTEGGYLYRAVSLPAGEYTISGDWDGQETTTVYVYSQTSEEALMNQNKTLYRGLLTGANFVVPEDTETVFFQVQGNAGDTVREIVLSDGTELPLAYRWIPEMIVYRLQGGLLSNVSFLQRVQFDKDAWTLFTQSPLIGHGLGSTEGLYTSVQPFFYETLYVHNHILQVMSDMGLLGLAAFLALLLGIAWLLLCALRTEGPLLAASLLTAWIMMNAHSLMEINFSVRAFQCSAFVLLVVPVLLYAKPISEKAVKTGGLVLNGAFCLYLAVFGALLESHRIVEQNAAELSASDAVEFMETMRNFVRRDVFVHENYKMTFVANAGLFEDGRYDGTAEKYVADLRKAGTYTACSGLARYYYLPKGEFEKLFACSRQGIAQEASTKEAWNLQMNFYRNEVLPAAGTEHIDEFMDGVLGLRDYLTEYSQGRLEEIQLTEENQSFLSMVSSMEENGISGETAYMLLAALTAEASESTTP